MPTDEIKFVSPVTTERTLQRMRTAGDGKRRPVRISRPTLQKLQADLRRCNRALKLAKAGSPLAAQLQQQKDRIIGYLNSLHAKITRQ
jgi:hypothetical protein